MDFRNRGLSSEDFEVAEHYRNRKQTISHPERYLGEETTQPVVDVFSQFKLPDLSSLASRSRFSVTGRALALEPRSVTYRPKDLPRDLKNPLHHIPTPRDLTLRYWWKPNLEETEEARLVGLAQSGDRRALAQLFKSFHKFILGVAGRHMRGRSFGNWNKQISGLFDDLVAAGCVGFCQALGNFDLSLGHRFSTLARRRIAGAISDEAVAFRKRGIKSEADRHRAIFRRTKRPVFKSFEEFARAKAEVDAWGRRESYADDPRSGVSDDLRRGDAEHQEFKAEKYGDADSPASSDAKWLYSCFGQNQFSGHLRWHGKPGRPDQTHTVSGLVEFVAIETDKRAASRLKQIGRRAYALELVEKQQRQLGAAQRSRLDYPDHLFWEKYPPTLQKTAPANDRKAVAVKKIINRQRKEPPIRNWRAA
jgi:hypothetical protein